MVRYSISLHIQSECRIMWKNTGQKNFECGHFSPGAITDEVHLGSSDDTRKVQLANYSSDFKDISKK